MSEILRNFVKTQQKNEYYFVVKESTYLLLKICKILSLHN